VTTWCVPGAPLEGGRGWRIWYSRSGVAPFVPAAVQVSRAGNPEATGANWWLFDALPGVDRRMGILTVNLANPAPGSTYDVWIPEVAASRPFRWRSLPEAVDENGVAFLLASCFWRDNDVEGAYSAAVRDLTQMWQPAFKLLVGDQVYQDYPLVLPFPSRTPHQLYAARYAEAWGDPGYQQVLQSCPNFFVCDDHEFWNNYPEWQPQLWQTLTVASRRAFGQAGSDLYEYYQRRANLGTRSWYRFAIAPVSFFVADSRSQRSEFRQPARHFFSPEQWDDLEQWARELRGPGVLVLGQPLFQPDGNWTDYSLSNYREDYGRLCAVIENSLLGRNDEGKPHDILMLSGDIHTGRYAVGRVAGVDAPSGVPEFISSSASRVGPHFGKDQPEMPPGRFTATHQGRTSVWTVETTRSETMPTIDDNVGMVRVFPGTGGRVRFELSIWRIRPFDARPFWQRHVRDRQALGLAKLFSTEIELR
jgi:hypothetical protein